MSAVIGHYINGEWGPVAGREVIEVLNPANGALVGAVVAGDASDVDLAVAAARAAFPAWAATSMPERIALVEALAEGLERHRDRLAETLTAEMGAPIGFARTAQVGVAIADLAALIAAARGHVEREAVSNSLVVAEPVGVVGAITPWNFPLHQIMLKLGAALLAGCTVVLKPSEVAPLNAAVVGDILTEIGVPSGVVAIVFGDGAGVGSPLVAHPDVDMVTFTGSRGVGEAVAREASRTIKKVALELGGKSAALILDDAPVEASVNGVLRSCFANTGQTCAALTRVLVPAGMRAEWERAAIAAIAAWTPGDPLDPRTAMGPLASELQKRRVLEHIRHAEEDGARLLAGGLEPLDMPGAYVRPTIFSDVTPGMRIFREEVFGPVLAITEYATLDEAITLANDSHYGLSGGVWSADERRALEVALTLRTGTVGINGAGLDVGAPFGGYKQSGLGREGGSRGFEEFLEFKAIMGAASLA
ncbi:aldehyde dehydrogenase family protein [Microbacterium album]|uniref:aldehyde dehydrogenase (NAD(+)) n=1 Tax=Microbacterium album TaxID=2053191 RepID=A0A917ICM8_9MICO|nr:aldehyde dehydrogenase family protein [Microbacterium album]GGH33330.1 aldehyde dehydrogenase [Microbacterium album]